MSARGRTGVLRPALVLLVGLGVVWLERRRALRRRREPVIRHTARNLAMAGLAAATAHLVEAPVVLPLAQRVERQRRGLVQRLDAPGWLRDLIAIVLLDYTLYLWHILVHRVPLLWRLHLVHHLDLDLDASTGVRFHFAEIAMSVPWRAAQVRLIGASPRALTTWQSLTLASVLFHHSNARLPLAWEQACARVVVTPRMHGIHHSIVRRESDANFSSGLALWDWLHGTIRLNVPQADIDIGVAAYRDPDEVGLAAALALPFQHDGNAWRLPGGAEPEPHESSQPRQRLLP